MVTEFDRVDLVIGGDGFIGRQLVSQLIAIGRKVLVVDKGIHSLRTFHMNYSKETYKIIDGDINDSRVLEDLESQLKEHQVYIWHLAANSDISKGSRNLDIDFRDTLLTSKSINDLASKLKTIGIFFASTSAVYGEYGSHRISESEVCEPISYYGMAKLASEHLLTITSNINGFPITILRFANIVGGSLTHGILFDFYKKLDNNSDRLEVLGNGSQTKTYLHVDTLVATMVDLTEKQVSGTFNIGPNDGGISVKEIVKIFIDHVSPTTQANYSKEDRGWQGDVPYAVMDSSRLIKQIGDSFQHQNSKDAIHLAIHQQASVLGIKTQCDLNI